MTVAARLPTLSKKSTERRTVTFDFTEPASGDPLAGEAVMKGAGGGAVPAGITVGTPDLPSGYFVTVDVSGGVHGNAYELHCTIGTASGNALDLGIWVGVDDQRN